MKNPDMKLDDSHKKPPFRVPEQYFEEFPDRMVQRIREEAVTGRGKMVSLPGLLKLGIAASFLILVTIAVFHLTFEEKTADQILAGIPTESLIVYLKESELTVDEVMETIDMGLVFSGGDFPHPGLLSDEEINDEIIEGIITDYELDLEL
jgi:hypothetical protein